MYCRLIVVLWCVYTAAFTTTGIENWVPFRSTRRIVGVDKVCFIDNSRSPIRQSCGIQIDMLGGRNFVVSFVAELARVSCTSPFILKGLKFDGVSSESNWCQSGLLLSSNSLLSTPINGEHTTRWEASAGSISASKSSFGTIMKALKTRVIFVVFEFRTTLRSPE